MESLERQILAVFDKPPAGAGSASGTRTLAEMGDSPAVSQCVARLIEQGWLRSTDAPNSYTRTEDGRLQLASPRDATIYSRPGCHLCEEAKQQITPLLKEFGATLTEINIDQDPVLRARYDYDVPVIFLGQRKVAKHRIDATQFRRQLRDAK